MASLAAPVPAPAAWLALQSLLTREPRTWLITGVAGFIGSHLLESLLGLDQWVVGLDNFSTGFRANLDQVLDAVGPERAARFTLVEGDLRDPDACVRAMRHPDTGGVRHVLHQAALGSVPRSLGDPLATHASNVTGFVDMLVAARDAGAESMVYASSSSVYGDHPALPKLEDAVGAPLSPYAVSKAADELYAAVFARCYGMRLSGLRYFNVFGRRQDPHGAYAAVIPLWTAALLGGQTVWINGDGETSRDFCHVSNAVQANLLAAVRDARWGDHRVYNIAVGERTTLMQLFAHLRAALSDHGVPGSVLPSLRDFRAGDVRHSLADIGRARTELGYAPTHRLLDGIREAMPWYVQSLMGRATR
ncbi:MAG: SDR family oxidoreductase [Pseudomonadota bacterium]|nr:SDR family oxidoreductase [Pseudomonadota bacterium]